MVPLFINAPRWDNQSRPNCSQNSELHKGDMMWEDGGREKLNVKSMPRNDKCSKGTKWPKQGVLCDHVTSHGEGTQGCVGVWFTAGFVSQFLLCIAKLLWWETTLKKIMEWKNIGTRISDCQSLKWNLALGILSNPSGLPLLSPYLWPSLTFHSFHLCRYKKLWIQIGEFCFCSISCLKGSWFMHVWIYKSSVSQKMLWSVCGKVFVDPGLFRGWSLKGLWHWNHWIMSEFVESETIIWKFEPLYSYVQTQTWSKRLNLQHL